MGVFEEEVDADYFIVRGGSSGTKPKLHFPSAEDPDKPFCRMKTRASDWGRTPAESRKGPWRRVCEGCEEKAERLGWYG